MLATHHFASLLLALLTLRSRLFVITNFYIARYRHIAFVDTAFFNTAFRIATFHIILTTKCWGKWSTLAGGGPRLLIGSNPQLTATLSIKHAALIQWAGHLGAWIWAIAESASRNLRAH